MKRIQTNEQGRSMVEMLGVLAVVGLLSVMAFAGFRIALNKAKANSIIHDARKTWVEALAWQDGQASTEWQESRYASESDKTFYAKRDVKENNYVKVEGVEEEVCQQILGLQKDGELIVLTETLRPFTECQETSDLIFGFDGVGRLIPCAASADCQEEGKEPYNGYCDTEEGYCHECGALELLNSDDTACVCDTSKAVSCSDGEGNSWCCGDDTGASNLICGGSAGSCVPNPDGKCWYDFAQTTTTKPLCHYTLSQTTTPKTLCHYQLVVDSNTNEGNVQVVNGAGCDPGYYCYLYYTENCQGTLGPGSTDLYGLCHKRDDLMIDLSCNTTTYTLTQEEGKGCDPGYYCYLYYTENCQGTLGPGSTDLYGLCHKRDDLMIDLSCNTTTYDLTENQGCPVGNFCDINWRNNSCNSVAGNQEGTLYGYCVNRTAENAPACPY